MINKKAELKIKFLIILVFLILITGLSGFSAYKVIKHYDLYANDPLVYGARNWDIDFCNCWTSEGNELSFNQTAVLLKSKLKYDSQAQAEESMNKFLEDS